MIPDKQAFPIVARERGDDGRKMPHLQITCRECGNHDYSVISTGTSPPPAITNGIFRKRGWNVGHKRSNDLCPDCNPRLGQAKAHEHIKDHKSMSAPAPPRPATVVAPLPPEQSSPTPLVIVAEPPPQPTRADRRRVLDALGETYEEDVGYRGAASDTTVARKLDVPRAWVTSIREGFFGPDDTNEVVITIRADIHKLVDRARALEDQGMTLAAQGESLRREAEKLAQSLSRGR